MRSDVPCHIRYWFVARFCHQFVTSLSLQDHNARAAMSIVLEQLSKRYEGHPVVNNVSLEVADGEFFVLLGPSVSGKSTILRMIAGLVAIDQGRVLLQGRDVSALTP